MFFGHNSAPWSRIGVKIGGKASQQLPPPSCNPQIPGKQQFASKKLEKKTKLTKIKTIQKILTTTPRSLLKKTLFKKLQGSKRLEIDENKGKSKGKPKENLKKLEGSALEWEFLR